MSLGNGLRHQGYCVVHGCSLLSCSVVLRCCLFTRRLCLTANASNVEYTNSALNTTIPCHWVSGNGKPAINAARPKVTAPVPDQAASPGYGATYRSLLPWLFVVAQPLGIVAGFVFFCAKTLLLHLLCIDIEKLQTAIREFLCICI